MRTALSTLRDRVVTEGNQVASEGAVVRGRTGIVRRDDADIWAACGDAGEGAVASEASGTSLSEGGGQPDDASSSGSGDAVDIDAIDLPGPGESRLEVAGQTFVFAGGSCTVTNSGFGFSGTSGDESERVQLEVRGTLVGDQWATVITATASGSGVIIHSQGDAVGTPAIDGSAIAVDAEFVRSETGDFNDMEDAGSGRLVANCG